MFTFGSLDCDDSDADCKKKQKNMMVMMMTMQSQVIFSLKLRIKFLHIFRRQIRKWDQTWCSRCFWWTMIQTTKIWFSWWWWAKINLKTVENLKHSKRKKTLYTYLFWKTRNKINSLNYLHKICEKHTKYIQDFYYN